MWRSKKFVIIAVLVVVLAAGSIGGVALAADNGDDSLPGARCGALLDKVCEMYNANPDRPGDIDCDILRDAIADAGTEMRASAIENRLAKMVENGVIDETQAEELQKWLASRPEALDDIPMMFRFGGRCRFHGMRGMHGFGVLCNPTE